MAMPTEPPAKPSLQPIVVTVTGAAGQIGYSLVPRIARGNMFGYAQPVILKLVDIPVAMEALKGLQMELEDAHFPLLKGVVLTDDPNVGFKDSDAAILLGAFPRKQGMERKDLMEKNIGIFRSMGEAIEKNAKKTIKVLVCGNPANTNCLVCAHYAPSIPKQNFTALTRLDHNRALAQVARRCNSSVDEVSNVIIWGNHSSTQYPDVNHGTVMGKKIYDAVGDTNWLQGEFVKIVQTRGGKIIEARKASSAFSAARACVMHMHDWFLGSTPGQHVSMGIYTDGSLYGIREGLMYSMPCKCSDGKWEVVRGLSVDDFSRKMMTATEEELAEEKALAFSLVQKSRL